MATKKPGEKKTSTRPAASGSVRRSDASKVRTLDAETRSNVRKVTKLEEAQKANRTIGEKVAERVAAFCGSMIFVYVHIVWFSAWFVVNSIVMPTGFDPFPYTFLSLVVSLEAIFLSTIILISQNHETQLTERRNHLDLQINMLAEQENTKMLDLLQRIAVKVGIEDLDTATEALLEPMDPNRLVEQIMTAAGADPKVVKPKPKSK